MPLQNTRNSKARLRGLCALNDEPRDKTSRRTNFDLRTVDDYHASIKRVVWCTDR